MPVRLLNLGGRAVAERVAASFPDVEIVRISRSEAPDPSLTGDVLLAMPGSAPLVAALAPRVRWVHVFGTGIDWLPPEAAAAPVLTCARGGSAVAIAEFVLAAMLAFEKQLPELWSRPAAEVYSGADLGGLADRTLGLVGFGGIARAVAARALPFGMSVMAVRRHPGVGDDVPPGVRITTELAAALEAADHLVLAAPATPETRHLIGREALARVKPGVHLVNVARGALVDHDALRGALDDGRVAMATLDVCDPEPPPPGHWLYDHPRVRLTGHISWSSPAGTAPLMDAFVENLGRFLDGRPLLGVVDRAEGY